jgi:hypothetical protein
MPAIEDEYNVLLSAELRERDSAAVLGGEGEVGRGRADGNASRVERRKTGAIDGPKARLLSSGGACGRDQRESYDHAGYERCLHSESTPKVTNAFAR